MLAVVLLVTGTVMGDDYRSALASCGATQSCGELGSQLFRGDGAIIDLVDLTLVVPLLFGLFWGAPLLSKEFEDGTHSLAWTQGVSRRHWLRVNIGWSLVAAALWGAALAVLVSYWRFPENALNFTLSGLRHSGHRPGGLRTLRRGTRHRGRVRPAARAPQSRRHAGGLRRAARRHRRLCAPASHGADHEALPPVGPTSTPSGAWILSTTFVNGHGQDIGSGFPIDDLPAECRDVLLKGQGINGRCLTSHGFHQLVTYQPDSRFWAFQGMEAGIFLVLALALVGFATWWVGSRGA